VTVITARVTVTVVPAPHSPASPLPTAAAEEEPTAKGEAAAEEEPAAAEEKGRGDTVAVWRITTREEDPFALIVAATEAP